jgi:NADH-quinone oxidoreductase subunit I
MYGLGILKSFSVTLRRLLMTYWDDIQHPGRRSLAGLWAGYWSRYLPPQQKPKERGIFTVQYPRERLPLPENFRTFPFLVLDPRTGKPRCRACGACARACPPQCIWIVRATDPETGKPKSEPAEFRVDVSICMSCGFCAEFCTFDAIKMDHDYEVADYERSFLWGLPQLAKPLAYHAAIHLTDYADEQAYGAAIHRTDYTDDRAAQEWEAFDVP